MDKQREMFEKRFSNLYLGMYADEEGGVVYTDDLTQYAWLGWQAAQKAQWQPIETAPVGVDVLVSRDFGKPPVVAGYFEETNEWLAFDDPFTHLCGLKFWMPLPPEPDK